MVSEMCNVCRIGRGMLRILKISAIRKKAILSLPLNLTSYNIIWFGDYCWQSPADSPVGQNGYSWRLNLRLWYQKLALVSQLLDLMAAVMQVHPRNHLTLQAGLLLLCRHTGNVLIP